jgi:NAD+ diphosphatase
MPGIMTEMIVFTGEQLDRAAERRTDPEWVAAQAESPDARAVLTGDAGIHVAGERLALLPLAALDAREPLLLGLDATGPVFAVDANGDSSSPVSAADQRWTARGAIAAQGEGPADPVTGTRPLGLRAAAAVLPQADAGLAAHAAALVNWHRRHRHCSVCGAPTAVAEGGIVRRCPSCGTDHHPRTDPVVIMLVTDGDRVLLGRQPTWPPGRYSALAGFVEPGESLEDAVRREVAEEVGIAVTDVRYHSSQPWPFPASIMLGFTARAAGTELRLSTDELETARWYTRAEMLASPENETFRLPRRDSIARRLVEDWLEG